MAIIYSYPYVNTVNNSDTLVISVSDTTADNGFLTKSLTADDLASYVTARVNLNFLGDTGTGVVNLDTQNLTISGTANEIETAASSQTLQIGLPDNVTITNNLTVGGTLNVTGQSTLSSVNVTDLTSGRVVLVGTNGELQDSSDLTFSGSSLTVGGNLTISGDFAGDRGAFANDVSVGADLTVSGLIETNTFQANGTAIISGELTMEDDIDMTLNGRIVNLDGPINAQDAATKQYVDTAVTGLLEFKGTFRADTGEILSGSNAGSYIYNCPGGAGTRVAIAVGDYYIVATAGGQFYCSGDLLQIGDSIVASQDAAADSSTVNDWGILEGDNIEGTGTVNKIPIWTDSQVLGNSNITQDNSGLTFTIGGLDTTLGNSGNFSIPGQITTGGSTSGTSSFSNVVSVGTRLDAGTSALAGSVALDVKQKATIRGGLVVSEFPGGVTVDNTSVVIGAGNNDIISGSDHCLAVGNNNQITNNSDNSVAFGQGNTLNEADASLVAGLSNTITGISGTTERSAVIGFSNSLQGAASVVYGGSNTVEIDNNAFVLGFDHDVLALSSDSIFVFGEQNIFSDGGTNANVFMIGADIVGSDGTMVLGYRNDKTQYPSEDNNNGLGETKFVVSVGSSTTTNSNALLITEGGVNKSNTPQIPRVILPTVPTFSASNDAAADAIGIPEGGLYQNNGVVQVNQGGGSTTDPLAGVDGSGTLNYIPKWTPDGDTLGDSQIFDNGTDVGIGINSPSAGRLQVDAGATTINQGIPATSGTSQNGILRLTAGEATWGETIDIGMNVNTSFPFDLTNYAWIQPTNTYNLAVNYNLILNPNGGKVGIGTKSPSGCKTQIDTGVTSLNQGVPATSGTSQNSILRLTPGVSTYGETLDIGMNVGPTYSWIQPTNTNNLAVNYDLILNPNGSNVGVGTTTPSSKLSVLGGDIEVETIASGLILKSPNGTRYRITVDNSGNLSTSVV